MAQHDLARTTYNVIKPSLKGAYDYLKPFVAQAYAYLKPFVKRAALNLARDILKDLADKAIAAANEAEQWGQGSSARANAWARRDWPAVERLDRRDNTQDGLLRARRCLSAWAKEGWPAVKRLDKKDSACDGLLRTRRHLSAWARRNWPAVERLDWRDNTQYRLLHARQRLNDWEDRALGSRTVFAQILFSLRMLSFSCARVKQAIFLPLEQRAA